MKTLLLSLLTVAGLTGIASTQAQAGPTVSLDSCRRMALSNNKDLMISRQNIKTADYQKQEAFAAYLPAIDFTGGYAWNQHDISLLGKDAMLPTKSFDPATGKYEYNLVTDPVTHLPIKGPDGQYIPSTVAVIPKDAMKFNTHQVFFGAVTLTQPIYMGGKIIAMNKITGYARDAAVALKNAEVENVIYAVDAAYWTVVSLHAKEKLAESYVNLLDSLSDNVHKMLEQGVCTRSDVLSVDVKLNSAQVDLAKVRNGVSLARMALAQVCGLPVDSQLCTEDENGGLSVEDKYEAQSIDMADVYARRPDLQALEAGVKVAEQKKKVALADMLPNLAVIGAYQFSNPNLNNGFHRSFGGGFTVGAVLKIPIWHWGGNMAKVKAAESEAVVMRLRAEDARELINLQVSQAGFKSEESYKTLEMTRTNLAKADENLRTARLAFREGVATSDNVMEAQTAWLKAHSENIDAMIDVRLCNTYLSKVTGKLYQE